MRAVENKLSRVIVYGRAHGDEAGRPLRRKLDDCQGRIERVSGKDGLEELCRYIDEADQVFAYDVREKACAGGGEGEHLEPVGKRCFEAAAAAIGDIVVNRMVIEADRLKGLEIGVRNGPRRRPESLAYAQLGEAPQGHDVMGFGIKICVHGPCSAPTKRD